MTEQSETQTPAAELKQSYAAIITRTGRFLVTTITLLTILVLIVELQLHENRQHHKSLEKQKRVAQKELRPTWREVNLKHSSIGLLLNSLRKKGSLRENKAGCQGKNEEEEYPEPTYDEQYSPPSVGAVKYPYEFLCGKLEQARAPIAAATDRVKLEELKVRQAGVKSATSALEDRRTDETKKKSPRPLTGASPTVPQTSRASENDRVKVEDERDSKLIGYLDDALARLSDYDRALDKYYWLAQEQVAASEELKKLDSEKPAFKTPLGEFNVQPALALLGLTFAAMMSYIVYISFIRRAGSYVVSYSAARSTSDLPIAAEGAPFWLFSTMPELQGALKWPGGRHWAAFLSVTFHAIWVLASAWLVWQCLIKWKSTKLILFGYGPVWRLLLVSCFALVLGLCVLNFSPPKARSQLAALGISGGAGTGVLVGRRTFLVAALAILAVSAVVGSPLLLHGRRRRYGLAANPLIEEFPKEQWIVHADTLAVHHEKVCAKHLPSKKNSGEHLDIKAAGSLLAAIKAHYEERHPHRVTAFYLHYDCQVNILEHLARSVVKGLPQAYCKLEGDGRRDAKKAVERAAHLLSAAIELSPRNYRLYDKLTGLYGYLCEYDRIHVLLNNAKQKIESELAALPDGSHDHKVRKERKRLKRARDEFQKRIDQAMLNARRSSQ
ncbi:MAG: hypothetical protein QOF61_2616 [Acidobacteriota bacterium]|jgi:hypothetical protein|nr:hypothetical protein [Acidobacteriota bacterium]